MNKIYLGSSKLRNNFKMFRVAHLKEQVMELMNDYLQKYDGKLINVKEMSNSKQLLVYFVTGQENTHANWESYIKNVLFKGYHIITSSIEIGPRVL